MGTGIRGWYPASSHGPSIFPGTSALGACVIPSVRLLSSVRIAPVRAAGGKSPSSIIGFPFPSDRPLPTGDLNSFLGGAFMLRFPARRRSGFTLIELLVVIAIIAILI